MVKVKRNGIPTRITRSRGRKNAGAPQEDMAATDQPLHQLEDQTIVIPNGFKLVPAQDKDTDPESNTAFKSKPKIQIFKGSGDKVSIENWLKRFDMIANYYKWSNDKKVIMLGNYLEDDSLNWYIENSDNCNYDDLKAKLISRTRIGVQTVEPIVEFFNLKYDIKKDVKEYFEQKRRYGVLAKLTEEQMIPVMIQGLHPRMISNFIAVKPKTFSEFCQIAKLSEDNLKRSFNTFNKPNNMSINAKDKPKFRENNKFKTNKKPPNPCKICENLGFKNRYHWAQDCYNKNKNSQTIPKQVNNVEQPDNESNEEYPIIENINLN